MFNIGLLIPNSEMMSRFGRSYKLALKMGLGPLSEKVTLSVETGGTNSGPIAVRSGLERLIVNHEPDLILAPLGMSILPEIENLLVAEEVPLIVSTLGENQPTQDYDSKFIRVCSYNLWESAWLTGYHAVRDFGPSVTLVSAFHDCGYGFGEAVRLGAEAAGGALVNNVVTRAKRASGTRISRAQSFDQVFEVETDSLILNYSADGVQYLHNLLEASQDALPPMRALAMTLDEVSVNSNMHLFNGVRSFLPKGKSGRH